jgi:Bifunctional DNA primase/polymerase, N-terminal
MTPDPLAAAQLGLVVFGLPPGSKRAAPGWHDRCTADPAELAASWRPGDNIGVGCRASGVVVIDLDRHDGKPDGVATFRALLARAGAAWPETLTVATASGGLHLYFTPPPGLAVWSACGAWPGVDVRGPGIRLGGYVAGPGSVVAGRAYTVADASPAAELPGWLAAALTWRQAARSACRARPARAVSGRAEAPSSAGGETAGGSVARSPAGDHRDVMRRCVPSPGPAAAAAATECRA